jgi:ABC-type branched-subunit amino acid transport system substrate-binding protein
MPHLPRVAPVLLSAALLAIGVEGCSLSNVKHEDCTSDAQCAQLFGLGSTCKAGFCTDSGACATGHDCREKFGGGACVDGLCQAVLPMDPACTVTEPEDLFSRRADADNALTVIGGIFSLEDPYDATLIDSARLAVREINRTGGGIDGRNFGIVFCDNGGPGNKATGDARVALDEHAIDYLSGTLGAPAVVGPGSSSDAIAIVNRLLKQKLPTVVISPSATSPALTTQPDRLSSNDPYGLFWRTCPDDQLQGAVLADDVIGPDATITKVSVVFDADPYGQGLSSVFTKRYKGTSTLVPYDVGGDVSGVGATVASQSPDAILVIALQASDAVAVVKSLAGAGLTGKKLFFSDGAKDKMTLLDPTLPADVQAMIQGAVGTVPARPSGPNYDLFKANLLKDFNVQADQNSFVAQAYDAAYCAAYGVVYAQAKSAMYDGRLVAEGLAHLSTGAAINVGPVDWTAAKSGLTAEPFQIDISGASGELDFDPTTGEAPAPIEVWGVAPMLSDFTSMGLYTPTG